MHELRYVLQFLGCVTPVKAAPGLLRVTMTARSNNLMTTIGPQGITSRVNRITAEYAKYEATMQTEEETMFRGSGTVVFGDNGHCLRFSTRTLGGVRVIPDPTRQQGTVTWQVDRGTGQFTQAQGVIMSVFLIEHDGCAHDTQVGVIFLP